MRGSMNHHESWPTLPILGRSWRDGSGGKSSRNDGSGEPQKTAPTRQGFGPENRAEDRKLQLAVEAVNR
jgi:hypothetical protein